MSAPRVATGAGVDVIVPPRTRRPVPTHRRALTAAFVVAAARFASAQQGQPQESATRVTDSVYAVFGGSNAYLVTTPKGNVLNDTCNPVDAEECFRMLKAVSKAPVRYIILT